VSLLRLIEIKRDAGSLTRDDWETLTAGLRSGAFARYQLAAFNVAAHIRGLSATEKVDAIAAARASGLGSDGLELAGIGLDDGLYGGKAGAGDTAHHGMLRRKIAGEALDPDAIRGFIEGVTDGSVDDAAIAAFTMAVYLHGMTAAETVVLTRSMLESGDILRWDGLPGPTVDKHSTGGVGDKVSLPLAGVLAACGAFVPMISGRGLGHTGGTLDKLESISGYRIDLSSEEIQGCVREVGAMIIGQTARLAPADRRLYAIRDVVGTVSSIPLITASTLSKKLAEGIGSLLLDVKVGSGGFMKTLPDARALAHSLVTVGQKGGTKVVALLTAMDEPIGVMIGNALEVVESVACLRGGGPEDLRQLVVAQAGQVLLMAGLADDTEQGAQMARAALDDGSALASFRAMVVRQGGDPKAIDDPSTLPSARLVDTLVASEAGYLQWLDAELVGRAVVALGGGRRVQEDPVDPAVGLILKRKVGARLEVGAPLLEIHANDSKRLEEAHVWLKKAIRVGSSAPPASPLLLEQI